MREGKWSGGGVEGWNEKEGGRNGENGKSRGGLEGLGR